MNRRKLKRLGVLPYEETPRRVHRDNRNIWTVDRPNILPDDTTEEEIDVVLDGLRQTPDNDTIEETQRDFTWLSRFMRSWRNNGN